MRRHVCVAATNPKSTLQPCLFDSEGCRGLRHERSSKAEGEGRLHATHRTRGGALAFVTCLIAFLALLAVEPQAFAQGAVRSVHGDWQIRCETPPGAQSEQCALFQSVIAEDRANVTLTVVVLKTADQKNRLMRVVAPLGVLLPSGLGLKIDQTDVGRAGFVRCLQRGCYAEVVMDDNLLKQLRTGTTATFIIFLTPEEGIGFPMSLKGFGDGYDKLP
jgi:invasion protein IalB